MLRNGDVVTIDAVTARWRRFDQAVVLPGNGNGTFGPRIGLVLLLCAGTYPRAGPS